MMKWLARGERPGRGNSESGLACSWRRRTTTAWTADGAARLRVRSSRGREEDSGEKKRRRRNEEKRMGLGSFILKGWRAQIRRRGIQWLGFKNRKKRRI